MAEESGPAEPLPPVVTRVGARRWSGWARRAVVVVGAVILALVAFALAPMVVREAPARGMALDTARPLIGQGERATQALRALGHSCADSSTAEGLVIRVCARVDGAESARTQLVVVGDTGEIKLARTSVDAIDPGRARGDIAEAVAQAVGLDRADQESVRNAATGGSGPVLTLGWGSFNPTVSAADGISELRAADWRQAAPPASTATLAASVDALAATATSRGYECTTPQVDTIRSCSRSAGGYNYDLWLQGTDTYATSVYLSVTAPFRRHTRSRWFDEMGTVFRGVDTDQARAVVTWLERSADAPGADTYIDGLSFSVMSRPDQGVKETFGGVSAECGRQVDDITACSP